MQRLLIRHRLIAMPEFESRSLRKLKAPQNAGLFYTLHFSHNTQAIAKNQWEDSITHCLTMLWLP